MARSFEPLGDRVLVKPVKAEEKTRSGLVLPDTAKERPQEGEVVAVGRGLQTKDGVYLPLEVKKGDHVLYAKFSGMELKEDGVDFLLLSERDILATVSGS
ncbi:MAG: co-chaperone GroES [Dehalococcoidia bacterium]|nr:co-chaperone GroES [Dehalococcoidia bacterium]